MVYTREAGLRVQQCMEEHAFMSKVVVEKEVIPVIEDSGSNGTGSNVAWALAMVIIVAMIVGALYYSGVLRRLTNQPAQKVNVEVKTP